MISFGADGGDGVILHGDSCCFDMDNPPYHVGFIEECPINAPAGAAPTDINKTTNTKEGVISDDK